MEREKSWETVTAIGHRVRKIWSDLADAHGLSISIAGLPALSTFSFHSKKALAYKTLITQEMLKKGYLANTAFYACVEHTPDRVDAYMEALDDVFAIVRECEDGRDMAQVLNGPVCHSGFKRLN
jgi:glutamate-1-semialdehyde 2,1-aminomutase